MSGNPLSDPGSAWFWVNNALYYLASAYCMLEWLRLVYHDRKLIGVQVLIIFLSAMWAFAEGSLGFLFLQIRNEVDNCYAKTLLYFAISTYLPLLMYLILWQRLLTEFSYSLILLFFIECYLFIKTKTDRYRSILYCTHLCGMSLVFLFFIIDKYVFCNSADPTLPTIGATVEDFNIAVSVMRLGFFILGIAVFFLVRGLSTTILAAKHDLVRARFTQVLFIYLPTFLGKFALVLLHSVKPSFGLNPWQLFIWIILVDILPTIAVVFSFRAKNTESVLADHTIVTYYHKEENDASWDSFAGLFHHSMTQAPNVAPAYETIEEYEGDVDAMMPSSSPLRSVQM